MTDGGARYREVRARFEALVELEPEAREAALAAIEDPGLRAEVGALLQADADPLPLAELARSALATGGLAPPLKAPTVLGAYRVIREVGRGGMGVVYEAEDPAPRRRVALKVLHPWLRTPALEELARREAQALADVHHSGIPSVFALVESEWGPVVVMEPVEGVPLREAVRGLGVAARLELLSRLCDTVDFAHQKGVVHRDLKPANVLVTAEGQPKVLDFGIAWSLGGSAPAGGGTPLYVAPEQRAGDRATPAADVWSLGVVAWELLTDGLPGQAPGANLRADLRAVLLRAMSTAPEARYPDAGALAAELQRVREDRPVHALPGLRPRFAAYARRNPRAIGAMGAAGVLVFGLWVARPHLEAAVADARAAHRLTDLQNLPGGLSDPDTARKLEGLLGDPELMATPAVLEGWRLRAATADNPEAVLEARAAEWVFGPEAPATTAALAAALRDAGKPEAALAVVAATPGTVDADLARWSFSSSELPAELRAPFAALARGTRLAEMPRTPLGGSGKWRREGDALAPVEGGAAPVTFPGEPSGLAEGDIDADGQPDLVVAVRLGEAGLYGVEEGRATVLHPGTAAQALPVRSVVVADLDGDGTLEVAAAADGWKGHELRVYAPEGAGLRLMARTRFAAWDVAATRDGTLWVLGGPLPTTPQPHGDRRWLIPFTWSSPTLRAGPPVVLDREAWRAVAADLDGDGHEELLLDADGVTGVLRPGGTPVWVPAMQVVAVGQGDADAADEVWGMLGGEPWVLGAGDTPVPARSPPKLDLAAEPPLRGPPRLQRAWARASALAAAGATEAVAERLVQIDNAVGHPPGLLVAAFGLLAPEGRTPAPGIGLLAAQVRGLPGLPAEVAAAVDAVIARTHAFADMPGPSPGVPEAVLRFATPLTSSVAVGSPGTVRRDVLGARLVLDVQGDDDDTLRIALRPDGGPLCVDVALELVELDWSAGLELALSRPGASARVLLWRTGGGPREGHRLSFSGPAEGQGTQTALTFGAHTVSLCAATSPPSVSAKIDEEPRLVADAPRSLLDGPLEFVIRPKPTEGYAPSGRARIALTEVRVRGGHFVSGAFGAPEEARARAFAEASTGAASALARALVAAADGAALAPAARDLTPREERWLLRVDPTAWTAPLREKLGSTLVDRWMEAWELPLAYGDPWALDALQAPDLADLPTTGPRGAAFGLARAEALFRAGQATAATRALDALPADVEGVARLRALLALRTGHPEAVRRLLVAALASAAAPERLRDTFADDPELGPLVTDVPQAPVLVFAPP